MATLDPERCHLIPPSLAAPLCVEYVILCWLFMYLLVEAPTTPTNLFCYIESVSLIFEPSCQAIGLLVRADNHGEDVR